MPLIRICDHFRNNPKRIDKLIALKGLPEEWFFRETPEGRELKAPWKPDIDANIPYDVRPLCEPMYIVFRYPPIEKGAKEVIEKRQVLGFKIDYNTEPGREMWDQVERYIEESTPRGERIPDPVVCSRDERSAFETFRTYRNSRGSLEFASSPVPLVDLNRYKELVLSPVAVQTLSPASPSVAVITPAVLVPQPPSAQSQVDLFICETCSVQFGKAQALRMHNVKKHPKVKETVGAK